jgi:hypothetical protein
MAAGANSAGERRTSKHKFAAQRLRERLRRADRSCSLGRKSMASQRFAVEFDRRTVGIAVRLDGGFVFYASDPRFEAIDGHSFRRARHIERKLRKIAERQARAPLAPHPHLAVA